MLFESIIHFDVIMLKVTFWGLFRTHLYNAMCSDAVNRTLWIRFSTSIWSAFPNAISQEPYFSQKNLGNFPSQAFGNILFPVLSQSLHLGLDSSLPVSVPKMKWEFPNLKFRENSGKIPDIWYWTGNFLLGTEICYVVPKIKRLSQVVIMHI